ncbi:HNH endonuclease [Clostridium sp. B9]|uniref:HNH endonuclease n=1 Tax=Clostridium sp. B9 TaxID=3423224 RepID=UPI003D2E9DE2
MRSCRLCGDTFNIQSHHVVSRKQQPALINCKLNQVDLCANCHVAAPYAIHKNGFKELKRLKLEKQREYYNIFTEDYYSKDIIKDILEIKNKEVDMLLKLITPNKNGLYEKEDIIRACMGGKLLIDLEKDL